MPVIVTQPYADYRYGSRAAVLVKEVSGVTSGTAAQAACGINKGDPHPENQAFLCDDWDVQQVAIGYYKVTFSYSDPTDQDFSGGNPLTQPTKISWNVGLTSEVFDRDIYGTAIANSAKDPFDRPAEAGVPELLLSVSRWEPAPFNVARAVSYIGTVNVAGTTVAGNRIEEGQCLCQNIAPIGEYTQSTRYIEVVYQFQLRKQGFDFRVLDQGKRGWINLGGRYAGLQQSEIFYAPDTSRNQPGDQQITDAVRLDGKGKPIDLKKFLGKYNSDLLDGPPLPPTVTVQQTPDAVFLVYKIYPRSDFSVLGL